MYKITLSDGTVIDNLTLNGNNFVSRNEIKAETFKGKLNHVAISCDDDEDTEGLAGEHNNMELVQIAHYTKEMHGCDEGWYFILQDISEDKLEKIRVNARLDYIEMMEDLA